MIKTNVVHTLIMLTVPLTLLASCGGKTEAPVGSSIGINPSALSITVTVAPATSTPCPSGNFTYNQFNISVIGPNGLPINNAQIYVTLDWSLETTNYADDTRRLYDDPNWVAGPPPMTEPTARVPGSYSTTTGDYGVKRLIVGTDLCTETGSLNVTSGTVFNSISIAVK